MPNSDLIYLFYCRAEKRKKLIEMISKKFPQIKPIDIHCAGRFNPVIAFNLLMKEKVKGVVLLGCDSGDCHYREGNLFSERRLLLAQETLKAFGLSDSSLQVLWHNPKQVAPIIKELETFVKSIEYLSKDGDSDGL